MRPIDADALIEKCGGWYVDECTESGFIGTLENILATEPTIQPQSTTGQLNDGARSTAQSTDLIDRQAAIDALMNNVTPYGLIDDDGNIESGCKDKDVVEMLYNLPPAQPEYRLDEWCMDCKEYDQEKHCCPRFNRVIREAAEEVRQSAQPEPHWIPCSERMPEVGQTIIAQCRANIIKTLKLDSDGDWYQDAEHCYMSEFVVAWMPLPEPYKPNNE